MTVKLPPAGANWVTGEKFFNRESERQMLRSNIENGIHTLLTGQRRMGKTSLARQVAQELGSNAAQNWQHLVVDLDACGSAEDMVAEIASVVADHVSDHQKLKKLGGALGSFFNKIEEVGVAGATVSFREVLTAGTWQINGGQLLSRLGEDKPCLLIIDELPNLLLRLEHSQGVASVELVLDWLRKNMQAVEAPRRLVFVVSGSIGVEPIVQRLKLSKSINQLEPMRVKPWSRETAKACLQARAAYDGFTYEDDALERLLDNLGVHIPFHVQRAAARLGQYLKERNERTAAILDIAHVYGQMISDDGTSMVQHYQTRLSDTLGESLEGSALLVLNYLSAGANASRDELLELALVEESGRNHFDWMLDVLVHDGYLEFEGGRWRFPSSVIRDWWQNRVASRA